MVHQFLASPYTDAARAGLYAAVLAALQADADTDSLLLGNLVLEDGAAPLDAVVVRPHGLTLLAFVPRGGRLGIPALGYGSWQLAGAPLPGADEFDNPHEQLVQQKAALASWLQPRFTPEQANLRFISSVVLFGAPVEFAPDVEPALNGAPAGFQLLSDVADLPRRLRQLATPEIDLSPGDLAEWAAELAAFAEAGRAGPTSPEPGGGAGAPEAAAPPLNEGRPQAAAAATGAAAAPGAPPTSAADSSSASPWGQRAGALWRWLGAADVPDDDPAYGYNPDAAAARSEEKQHLEQLRQQMQADVNSQLQALETREAERERSIAQLRAELAQAPPVAAEAAALVSRLGAETREKAAVEAAMQASRAESAARNQELDAKIQQLGQLIEQLSTRPAPDANPGPNQASGPGAAAPAAALAAEAVIPAVSVAGAAAATRPAAPTVPTAPLRPAGAGPAPRFRQWRQWRRRLPRLALAAGVLAALGLGGWGLSHLGSTPPVPFQENGRWGYADADGKPVLPARYTAASPFQAGQAVVAVDGAYGIIDEKGQETVAPTYDALNPYAGGFARARVGDTYTFVDEKGQEFDHYYFNALDFAEGHAAVLDHRGWHYLSGPTEPATPPVIFPEAYSFADGLARVKLADGYTYITKDYLQDPARGTKPFGRYELAADFADGKARVTQGGRRFVIDKDGEEVK